MTFVMADDQARSFTRHRDCRPFLATGRANYQNGVEPIDRCRREPKVRNLVTWPSVGVWNGLADRCNSPAVARRWGAVDTSGERISCPKTKRCCLPYASRGAATQSKLPRTTAIKILDAAEALFSERNFDVVSVRDITATAGVTLALMSYHYGTKEALFEAVIARRAELLSRTRRERLTANIARRNYGIRDVLDAYVSPMFEFAQASDIGWRNYISVLVQLGREDRWGWLLAKYFDDTAQTFLLALREAAPDVPQASLFRGFLFFITIMLSALSVNSRREALSQGILGTDDVRDCYPDLLDFATGGLSNLSNVSKRVSPKKLSTPRSRPGGSARKK
jgi:AcrR family transcriptional regulator